MNADEIIGIMGESLLEIASGKRRFSSGYCFWYVNLVSRLIAAVVLDGLREESYWNKKKETTEKRVE
jgi:hypothetical protein